MLPQEISRGVGTVDFETLRGDPVFLGKPHVMKHGPM
jgi:hypothetical protein